MSAWSRASHWPREEENWRNKSEQATGLLCGLKSVSLRVKGSPVSLELYGDIASSFIPAKERGGY